MLASGAHMRWLPMSELFSFSKKKKIGVALGSGGAKGMAHLGILQAMWESGIDADIYAGTSAGSIVGAMCARGYSPADIVELLKRLQYGSTALATVLSGSLESALPLLDDALGGVDIGELSKPFCAVATDSADGSEVLLKEGNAARAVLASSSIPPMFKGIRIGERLLVDGAFSNAIPADAARALGADVVIGVALSPALSYEEVEFVCSSGETRTIRQKGFLQADLLLEPDLSAFRTTDILYASQIYDAGYDCAISHMQQILHLCGRAAAQRNRG